MARKPASHYTLETIPDQIAVRYRPGHEKTVRERLAAFGRIEEQPLSRILILHFKHSVPRAAIDAELEALHQRKLIEFATPVMRASENGTRQVLTDEIVLRLKSRRAQQRTLETLKDEHGLKIGRRNEFEPNQYVVKVKQASGTRTLDVARLLDERADVEFASPNFLTELKR